MRRHSKKQVNRLVATSIVASVVALSALSQAIEGQPRLVVGIVIDQLRGDYLQLLQPRMTQGGFNRLAREGVVAANVKFDCGNIDCTAGTALLMTGAYPCINGIPASKVYNFSTHLPESVFADKNYIGNFTSDTASPMALRVSTLADEVRVSNNGLGYVYAIAPDAPMALALAGHAANCGLWIDDATGKWASTTFYKDMPQCMQTRNYNNTLAQRLDTMRWQPSAPLSSYTAVPGTERYYKFSHTYSKQSPTRYKDFKQSGLVNQEVADAAIDCIKQLKLGNRGQFDMISVGLTAAGVAPGSTGSGELELQDAYLRLDRQVARLLSEADKAVGAGHTLVFLASTGHYETGRKVDPKFNIPTGEFSVEKAKSLLNVYLMAIYGNGSWVDGYYNHNFYLNRKLIAERNISLQEVRAKSSEFLRQMSGVAAAYTFEELLNNPVSDRMRALSHVMVPATAGDVAIDVIPGWNIVEQSPKGGTVTTNVSTAAFDAPIYIMAPGLKSQRITSVIDAAALAPSVARLLRIRAPNAASAAPLQLR